MAGAAVCGELQLELLDLCPEDKSAAAENAIERTPQLAGQRPVLAGKVHEGNACFGNGRHRDGGDPRRISDPLVRLNDPSGTWGRPWRPAAEMNDSRACTTTTRGRCTGFWPTGWETGRRPRT